MAKHPNSTPLSRRLTRAVQEAGLLEHLRPEDCAIHRYYPGAHQRAAGAWLWELVRSHADGDVPLGIGSEDTATACARGCRAYQDPVSACWAIEADAAESRTLGGR